MDSEGNFESILFRNRPRSQEIRSVNFFQILIVFNLAGITRVNLTQKNSHFSQSKIVLLERFSRKFKKSIKIPMSNRIIDQGLNIDDEFLKIIFFSVRFPETVSGSEFFVAPKSNTKTTHKTVQNCRRGWTKGWNCNGQLMLSIKSGIIAISIIKMKRVKEEVLDDCGS